MQVVQCIPLNFSKYLVCKDGKKFPHGARFRHVLRPRLKLWTDQHASSLSTSPHRHPTLHPSAQPPIIMADAEVQDATEVPVVEGEFTGAIGIDLGCANSAPFVAVHLVDAASSSRAARAGVHAPPSAALFATRPGRRRARDLRCPARCRCCACANGHMLFAPRSVWLCCATAQHTLVWPSCKTTRSKSSQTTR